MLQFQYINQRMRMTVAVALVLLTAVVGMTLYLRQHAAPHIAHAPGEKAVIGTNPSPMSPTVDEIGVLTITDVEVLDTLLNTLLDDPEFDLTHNGSTGLMLLIKTPSYKIKFGTTPRTDKTLGRVIADELRTNFARRNRRGNVSLAAYKPSSPLVTMRAVPLAGTFEAGGVGFDRSAAKCYVRPYLPAYSDDGLTAGVEFFFGPTDHGGGSGTYLLHYDGHKWIVIGEILYMKA